MADLEDTIKSIRKATKGFGTDEEGLIDSLARLTVEQLPELEVALITS